ncbi:sensor histidine kinase [Hymenobacter fodinae]|uniref:Histidine kinase n=1 Tax=Hymenobacter fodinae TaxID=2510796 RepID=A0A4Z0P1B5_9BACT|nr:histidine kinase [Hymenobacter fodinae]TGE03724.1 histidine kinase [Hymenobacter fodinae]
MKPKLLPLTGCFLLFYFLTHTVWALNGHADLGSWTGFGQHVGRVLGQPSAWTFLVTCWGVYLLFYTCYPTRGIALTLLLYLLLALPAAIAFRYGLEEVVLYRLTGRHQYGEAMLAPRPYFLDNLYFAFYYSAVGVVFFFVQHALFAQQRQQQLQGQLQQAELAFLKSQVNPHFLFNSLNNIYALVYQESANALPAISQLSELLRYLLYEKSATVPLQQEVAYLQNFIDLQLLRYDYIPALRVHLPLPTRTHPQILPLTLIPLVENAFKHGSLKDPQRPLTIELHTAERHLTFCVRNATRPQHKDAAGGIGLTNLRQRLALVYPGTHRLQLEEVDGLFTATLTLPLHA